jgi:hypothetical protein
MELLPAHLRAQIPKLLSQEQIDFADKTVYAKYFIPDAGWTWFATEGQEKDGNYVFFGYVISQAGEEWGLFYLRELEEVNEKASELKGVYDMGGLSVELADDFQPTKFKNAIAEFRLDQESRCSSNTK